MYSISHHAEDKPVIVFVPSRKLSRDIAKDLITHTSVEQSPKRYLHCSVEDLQPLLQRIESRALRETLSLGVGFYHEAMAEGEKEVVMKLFSSGAIQVLIATHSTAWEISPSAHLVVVMGTEYYEGKEHTYVDYQITKLLQMIGRAGVAGTDESAKCIIFGHSRKKEFYKKFIHEPLPIESHLDHYLQDHFNAEIVTRTIENKQDAVDYLTWTFYYRRITQNPNYYNLQGVSHMMVSDHLSELVESTLKDLEDAKCVLEDDSDLTPVNLGIIASY
jgi:pre-mRNA-splicing helicase BRR2